MPWGGAIILFNAVGLAFCPGGEMHRGIINEVKRYTLPWLIAKGFAMHQVHRLLLSTWILPQGGIVS